MIAKKTYMLVLAAALVAAAPAHAQRVSLADRVAALEAKANNPQQNLDLLNRITQQETELRELRAQLEQLQNENEQLKQRNRDQYVDLDSRLQRLEGVDQPPHPGGARHELRDALCAGRADRVRVEAALLPDDRLDQQGIDPVPRRRPLRPLIRRCARVPVAGACGIDDQVQFQAARFFPQRRLRERRFFRFPVRAGGRTRCSGRRRPPYGPQ